MLSVEQIDYWLSETYPAEQRRLEARKAQLEAAKARLLARKAQFSGPYVLTQNGNYLCLDEQWRPLLVVEVAQLRRYAYHAVALRHAATRGIGVSIQSQVDFENAQYAARDAAKRAPATPKYPWGDGEDA